MKVGVYGLDLSHGVAMLETCDRRAALRFALRGRRLGWRLLVLELSALPALALAPPRVGAGRPGPAPTT